MEENGNERNRRTPPEDSDYPKELWLPDPVERHPTARDISAVMILVVAVAFLVLVVFMILK